MPARPKHAAVFAALGDNLRLTLVRRLCDGGPQSITRLARGSRVSRQAVTKHLLMLERAGLACHRRAGREQVWELEAAPLGHAREYLENVVAQWDAALHRLKAFLEN